MSFKRSELRRELRYATHHQRIRKARGRAAEHRCVDCGKPAAHWSFNHLCPDRRLGSTGLKRGGFPAAPMWFCPHVECYDPRCSTCHKAYDARIGKGGLLDAPFASH